MNDLVDDAVGLCLFGSHKVVTLTIAFDGLNILTGILGKNCVEFLLDLKNLLGLNLNVGTLAAAAAGGLVYHDLGIGQSNTLALCTGGQQKRTHGCGHADTNGGHIRLDVLHGVIYRKTRADTAAGAVDQRIRFTEVISV